VGDGVTTGGQVGVADHLTLGDGVKIAAQSGIARDVPAGQAVFGSPAYEARFAFRLLNLYRKLPEMAEKLREIEAALEKMKGQQEDGSC
jgi:UDP-3-O-[3-hydroxymyristoyl] glucosamine N-acyltransferase